MKKLDNKLNLIINSIVGLAERTAWFEDYEQEYIDQIKQSILKAIMEKLPEKQISYGKFGTYENEYEQGRNNVIEEFESVIKEILGEPKQKKLKGVFMPYNPNNY